MSYQSSEIKYIDSYAKRINNIYNNYNKPIKPIGKISIKKV